MNRENRTNPSYNYLSPREIAPNLWELSGEWNNKFGRRMTVIRLKSGELFIHNAFHLKMAESKWLASMGTVQFIVAPNTFHCSEAGWMKREFPQAKLFVPKSKLAHFKKQGLDAIDTESDFPDEIANELLYLPSRGTKIEEAVFLHRPSRTLILTDLAFNMGPVFKGLEKFVMNFNFLGGGFGPSRALKWVFTKDQKELRAFFKELLQLDFDRVIVNHGDIVESDGKSKLKTRVTQLFGPLD